MKHKRPTRRTFLQTTTTAAAAGGLGFWIARRPTLAEELAKAKRSPNERINVVSIGVAGKGGTDTDNIVELASLVAMCDVDSTRLANRAAKLEEQGAPPAETFTDFREMLDKMGKDVDAVTISTPDHTHAVATMLAMQMGKHVYTQKPLTHDVWEARQLRLCAQRYKVQSQMGNQGTASPTLREGVEMIRAGVLGKVSEVHIWTNRPVWPQSPEIRTRPAPASAPPEDLNWDLWLGPAPERPFSAVKAGKRDRGYYHPFNWRGWWDFGTGALGDMGCHTANLPFTALNLGHPSTIQAESEEPNPETYPAWAKVNFEFPARGDMPPVKVTWYEGRKDGVLVHPPAELVTKVVDAHKAAIAEKDFKGMRADPKKGKDPAPAPSGLSMSGSIIVGERGILYSPHDYGGEWWLLPHDRFGSYESPPQMLPRTLVGDPGMKTEWLAAIGGEGRPMSNFDYGGMLTEFILLGNIGIRARGKKLEWDGPNMKFPNAPEAEQWLKREYRKPWAIA
jgi:predicted dehydrogenase